MPLAPSQENTKIQDHVLKFIQAKDKAGYVLDLFDEWVVNNPQFPPRADVSYELRKVTSAGGKVLLEGPQSYFLSNAAEKIWDSGTSANTDASAKGSNMHPNTLLLWLVLRDLFCLSGILTTKTS